MMRSTRTVLAGALGGFVVALALAYATIGVGAVNDAAVQRLLDKAEIEDVLVRYTHALDTLDADKYASVFAEDAVFEQGAGQARRGRGEIRSIITGLQQRRAERAAAATEDAPESLMHHVMTNATLDIVDDREAHHYAYWMTIIGNTEDGFRVAAMGHYEDVLMKRDGHWLIQNRKLLR
jgi:uncharacterized protein (TIGR02246 family)